jgi:hypothetical protein
MAIGQKLRDRARALRAQANDQATAEAALAFRLRAAWLDRQVEQLELEKMASQLSLARPGFALAIFFSNNPPAGRIHAKLCNWSRVYR